MGESIMLLVFLLIAGSEVIPHPAKHHTPARLYGF